MKKTPKKKLWKRIKRVRNKCLMFIVKYTIPYIYYIYLQLVWRTSKVETNIQRLDTEVLQNYLKMVSVLWHQDVFLLPIAYAPYKPHTIASVGDAGEIITRLLQMFNYTVFRGGSSKGKKRKKKILDVLISRFKEIEIGITGITVDGSSGPPYRLKRGAIVVAKECKAPIYLARIWAKRKILLPTWDKTMIPFPFNTIHVKIDGPYFLPENIEQQEVFEEFRTFIEDRLLQLTYRIFIECDGKVPKSCQPFFPENWKPDQK